MHISPTSISSCAKASTLAFSRSEDSILLKYDKLVAVVIVAVAEMTAKKNYFFIGEFFKVKLVIRQI